MTIFARNQFVHSLAADTFLAIVAFLSATGAVEDAALVQDGSIATDRRALHCAKFTAALAPISFAKRKIRAAVQFSSIVTKMAALGCPRYERYQYGSWNKNF